MKLILLIGSFFLFSTVYDITLPAANGDTIKMSDFKGKMVLVVNIASQSSYVDQLRGLDSLYIQHKDKLVIIACPSNSFGHEPLSDSEISSLLLKKYNIHFLVGGMTPVTGDTRSPLYQWLGEVSRNGVSENTVAGDFQKYLISPEGKLIGFFAGEITPDNALLHAAISGEVR